MINFIEDEKRNSNTITTMILTFSHFVIFSDQKLNQLEDAAKAAKKGKWADDASVSVPNIILVPIL